MSVEFTVEARTRSDGGKGASRRLRREGLIPGIIYGGRKNPEMISLQHNVLLQHLANEAFYSHILELRIGDHTSKVVLKDLQRHPAKPFILHADFMRISADEKIRMVVPLHFLNEETAVGVKAGGVVSHNVTEVEITCLPKDLPAFIDIDVQKMEIGDIVPLSGIAMPAGVELARAPDPDEPVVIIHSSHGADEDEEGEPTDEEGAAEE